MRIGNQELHDLFEAIGHSKGIDILIDGFVESVSNDVKPETKRSYRNSLRRAFLGAFIYSLKEKPDEFTQVSCVDAQQADCEQSVCRRFLEWARQRD